MDIVSHVKSISQYTIIRRAQLELLKREVEFIENKLQELVYPEIDVNMILEALKDESISVEDASFVLNINRDHGKFPASPSLPSVVEISSKEITELFDPLMKCINSGADMPAFKAPSTWELEWTCSYSCWTSSIEIKTTNQFDICAYLMIMIDNEQFAVLTKIEKTNMAFTWYTRAESKKYKLVVIEWSNTDEWVMTINIE